MVNEAIRLLAEMSDLLKRVDLRLGYRYDVRAETYIKI